MKGWVLVTMQGCDVFMEHIQQLAESFRFRLGKIGLYIRGGEETQLPGLTNTSPRPNKETAAVLLILWLGQGADPGSENVSVTEIKTKSSGHPRERRNESQHQEEPRPAATTTTANNRRGTVARIKKRKKTKRTRIALLCHHQQQVQPRRRRRPPPAREGSGNSRNVTLGLSNSQTGNGWILKIPIRC